jgi:uncharacterized membrane protein YcfT
MKKLENCYWIVIFVSQLFLLYKKIPKNEFYLWNIIAFVGAIFFLYNRIRLGKVLKNHESIIVLFLIFNSISTFATQLLVPTSNLELITSPIIALFSVFIIYKINTKSKVDNN